jgi:type II pantothenate kinase
MAKQDEMDSLVAGMQFVMSDIVGECYTFKPNDWRSESSSFGNGSVGGSNNAAVNGSLRKTPSQNDGLSSATCQASAAASTTKNRTEQNLDLSQPIPSEESKPRIDQWWTSKKVQRDNVMGAHAYPYLLVSIGTGVSILRVDGPRQHERVSGSTIGGGTYWGLCRLLTGSDSFSDVLNLAMKGDPSKVDMMVGDIYGKNSDALEKIGLPSDIVASSFGKLVAKQNPSEDVKEEDLARALLLMVTNNIGQVAHLNARLHNTARIYFVGTFLQHNTISQQRLAHAIDYWSKGEMEAQFLEHEGYFGALGAFLLNHGIEGDVNVGSAQPVERPQRSSGQRKKRPSVMKLHQRSKSMNFTEV